MKTLESKISEELTLMIKKATDFHGHLGPFLVIASEWEV
jgi:formylmethanofuran dehydrogenase subunit E